MTDDRVGDLVQRIHGLRAGGRRVIVGITGPPGVGKSWLAGRLEAGLGDASRTVPMDGFHLAQAELERRGLADRKGAIETFDAHGYLALLRRLRDPGEAEVLAPVFRRELEEPVAGSVAVAPVVPVVLTEGNYLLAEADPWPRVRALLDEVWYVEADEGVRRERLLARHVEFGRSRADAEAWMAAVDQPNAALIAATRARADLVIGA